MYYSLGSRSVLLYHLYTVVLTCTRCPGILPIPFSTVEFIVEQPTSVYAITIIVNIHKACSSLFIQLFNSGTVTQQNLHT